MMQALPVAALITPCFPPEVGMQYLVDYALLRAAAGIDRVGKRFLKINAAGQPAQAMVQDKHWPERLDPSRRGAAQRDIFAQGFCAIADVLAGDAESGGEPPQNGHGN